jgi:hypothetical protein
MGIYAVFDLRKYCWKRAKSSHSREDFCYEMVAVAPAGAVVECVAPRRIGCGHSTDHDLNISFIAVVRWQ